jgi:hypothetical protein
MKSATPIEEELKVHIDDLYRVFSSYARPEQGIITCLDFGPTEDESQAFSKPLREIPRAYIFKLEFYDRSWNSWGTEEEVKYLTPRVLEAYVENVQQPETWSKGLELETLIRFKMQDLDEQAGHPSKWTKQEATRIKEFLLSFFKYLSVSDNIETFLDFMSIICITIEDVAPYMAIWQEVPAHLRNQQIQAWVKKFLDAESFDARLNNIPDDSPSEMRANRNIDILKQWVLSEENILENVEFFSADPYWKLVTGA